MTPQLVLLITSRLRCCKFCHSIIHLSRDISSESFQLETVTFLLVLMSLCCVLDGFYHIALLKDRTVRLPTLSHSPVHEGTIEVTVAFHLVLVIKETLHFLQAPLFVIHEGLD